MLRLLLVLSTNHKVVLDLIPTFCKRFRELLSELTDELIDGVLECILGLSMKESNEIRLECVCGTEDFLLHGRP